MSFALAGILANCINFAVRLTKDSKSQAYLFLALHVSTFPRFSHRVSWQPDMSQATTDGQTRVELEIVTSLFDVLHNCLILRHIAPYLPIYSLLRLSATSKDFRSLIRTTPGVFRHLDLTRVKKAKFDVNPIDNGGEVWRNVQVDENLTEDE